MCFIYSQRLKECLAHNKCLINTWWMNDWLFGRPFLSLRVNKENCWWKLLFFCSSQPWRAFVLTHVLLERNSVPGFDSSLSLLHMIHKSQWKKQSWPHSLWVVITTFTHGPFQVCHLLGNAREIICHNILGYFMEESISLLYKGKKYVWQSGNWLHLIMQIALMLFGHLVSPKGILVAT